MAKNDLREIALSDASDGAIARAFQKGEIIDAAEKEVQEIEGQYTSGLVTQGERYNKVVDIWGRAGDVVAKAIVITSYSIHYTKLYDGEESCRYGYRRDRG